MSEFYSCRAEPSRAESSLAEPSRAEPSRTELSRAEPSQAECGTGSALHETCRRLLVPAPHIQTTHNQTVKDFGITKLYLSLKQCRLDLAHRPVGPGFGAAWRGVAWLGAARRWPVR